MMFGHPDVKRSAALKRLKEEARALFAANEDDVVVANELRCSEPGCPPFEVVVALLSATAPAVQVRVHKAAVDVTAEDLRRAFDALPNACP